MVELDGLERSTQRPVSEAEQDEETLRTIRRLWAAALPSGQRYVFVTSAGDRGADLEAERLLHDDLLQLDLLPSDLYSEHKALLLSLYFSLSRCRSVQHTVLLDQNVLGNISE